MAKSVRLKNNLYLDSTSIVHNKKKLSDILYPVGSVYISTNSTNPSTLFGGSWTQITGRFLYCTTTSKTTGGSTTTGSTALTIDQIPSHNHRTLDIAPGLYAGWGNKSHNGWVTQSAYQSNGGNWEIGYTGGGKGHTHSQNLPPYFTVYAWYRTA